jgi:Fe-S cluster assembly protein SufD
MEIISEHKQHALLKPLLEKTFSGNAQVRQAAVELLQQTELPTRKHEDWKYTNLAKLNKEVFSFREEKQAFEIEKYLPENGGEVLVFVNGFFRADLSTASQEYTLAKNTQEVSLVRHSFLSILNTAGFSDGLAIRVKGNVEKSLNVLCIASGDHATSQLRHIIHAEKNASCEINLIYVSADEAMTLSNVVTEIHVEANAEIHLNIIQNQNPKTWHFDFIKAHQEQDSRLHFHTLSLNGALVRNDLQITSAGRNTDTWMSGLALTKGDQHVDNHTIMDHTMPDCTSNELYKTVADDASTVVFNGKVFVRPDAQKINAYQSNANILLSENAQVFTKPELEIYADDVKCSHGTTTGQMDEEALFYLRARGVGEQSARKMMVHAFASDVLTRMKSEAVRNYAEQIMEERFHWNN